MKKRTNLRLIAVIALAALAVAGVAGYRYLRRPASPASAQAIAAMRSLTSSGSATAAKPDAEHQPDSDRGRLVAAALSLQGVPYKWGGKGPADYDCSGFTKAAYLRVGIVLPDGSFNQAKGEKPLSNASQLAAGDLIFYRWKSGDGVTHVTMYAGRGWVVGTGTPGEPLKVTLYPLAHDLVADGRALTYRHIVLADER